VRGFGEDGGTVSATRGGTRDAARVACSRVERARAFRGAVTGYRVCVPVVLPCCWRMLATVATRAGAARRAETLPIGCRPSARLDARLDAVSGAKRAMADISVSERGSVTYQSLRLSYLSATTSRERLCRARSSPEETRRPRAPRSSHRRIFLGKTRVCIYMYT
jgi:hypothetical protein